MPASKGLVRSLHLAYASSLIKRATAQPCYWRSNNTVRSQDPAAIYPCPDTETHPGGTQLCCIVGSQCGSDSICRFPEATVDGAPPYSPGRSGWNTGGCTDPSYSDPVCPTECNDWGRSRIVWDTTTDLWHCCGHENCTTSPTNETFEAASPQDWRPIVDSPTSTSSNLAIPSTTSITIDESATSTSEASSNKGAEDLSLGAQVGIGISCGIVGLSVALALLYLCRRKKKASRDNKQYRISPGHPSQEPQNQDYGIALMSHHRSEAMSEQKHEMSNDSILAPPELGSDSMALGELPTEQRRYELEGNELR